MPIPLYPRGRPASEEMDSFVEGLFVLADVDMKRGIEPPMSEVELRSNSKRPTDEVLLDRFAPHARKTVRGLTESTILVLPWRPRVDHALKAALTSLASKLNFRINTGPQSRHVLLIENYEAAMDFEDYTRRDGTVLGKLHQGGIWCSTDYGRFFLVTWQSTVPVKTLADKLKEFLTTERAFPAGDKAGEEKRLCLTPPPITGPVRRVSGSMPQVPAKSSRRPSSISFRAVTDRRSPTEPPDSDRASLKRRP